MSVKTKKGTVCVCACTSTLKINLIRDVAGLVGAAAVQEPLPDVAPHRLHVLRSPSCADNHKRRLCVLVVELDPVWEHGGLERAVRIPSVRGSNRERFAVARGHAGLWCAQGGCSRERCAQAVLASVAAGSCHFREWAHDRRSPPRFAWGGMCWKR